MNREDKERRLVEEIKMAIDAVGIKNFEIIKDKSERRLDDYFCKKIKKVVAEKSVIEFEFYNLPAIKFLEVEVIYGKELLVEEKIRQINFIKIIKRQKRLYISAMVELKKHRGFDFLEFYAEEIYC